MQNEPLKLFCKKDVLKNFANFKGKHLCWSFFLKKVPKNTYFQEHLGKKNENLSEFIFCRI